MRTTSYSLIDDKNNLKIYCKFLKKINETFDGKV